MQKIFIDDIEQFKDYLVIPNEKFNIVISTAKEGRSFNRHNEEGQFNLKSINKDFNLKDVQYLMQVHSDKVLICDEEVDIKENEGDALITNKKEIGIGVFTADCVPIILIDELNLVVAAIHSGWKGTYNSITKKTVKRMVEEFGCLPANIKAYIGPHIRECCYEISEELKVEFIKKKKSISEEIFTGKKLSMERCIKDDLLSEGLKNENIFSLNLCTYCSEEVELFSYRKSIGTYGRLFSFVSIKK